MQNLILFGVMFAAILIILGLMAAWSEFIGWRESVKDNRQSRPVVMSRVQEAPPTHGPSDLGTGPDQGPDRTIAPPFDKVKLLDTYRRLRALGASRNAARELLQIWGVPLHNDLWAKAAPEEEPALTPIAGRPTPAKFHEGDPELEYQPLR